MDSIFLNPLWPSLVVTHPLLFSLNSWHRWMAHRLVEAVCRHETGGGHVDWSPHLRKFASMKIQVPHFREGFGITPNEGSAISAFYSATCALVVWLGNRPAQDFANTWAPRLNLTSPDSWHAPLLQALSALHALLLQDCGCVEWTSESDRVPAPLAVSIALPFM